MCGTIRYYRLHRMTKHVRCRCQKWPKWPVLRIFLSERGRSRFCKRLYSVSNYTRQQFSITILRLGDGACSPCWGQVDRRHHLGCRCTCRYTRFANVARGLPNRTAYDVLRLPMYKTWAQHQANYLAIVEELNPQTCTCQNRLLALNRELRVPAFYPQMLINDRCERSLGAIEHAGNQDWL